LEKTTIELIRSRRREARPRRTVELRKKDPGEPREAHWTPLSEKGSKILKNDDTSKKDPEEAHEDTLANWTPLSDK
jgi:hypothetical protein